MGFSSSEAIWCFHQEIRRKRAMCYRPRRRQFPLDGFWRPGAEDMAPALISMEEAIEAEVNECASRPEGEMPTVQQAGQQLLAAGERNGTATVRAA